MKREVFKLTTAQLKDIARALQQKIEEGLGRDGGEILALPTYITPDTGGVKGEALVLDLGGTNYRVATVGFDGPEPHITPENGWKRDLSEMKTPGYTEAQLLDAMAEPVDALNITRRMPIGYCFSFPAESMQDGDGRLLVWTKGVNIDSMVGKPVGKPLMDHMNGSNGGMFTGIKVINDTVASLFAGLTHPGYDSYIGLIVGTGTNMASFHRVEAITKLGKESGFSGVLPVNLESGNFVPPHLTEYDRAVDAASDKPGNQRFEKAISGFYLGEILKAVFPQTDFGKKFDAERLTEMLNYPDLYKEEYVEVARAIYERSAALVAASIAGLMLVLRKENPSAKRIMLTAEGGLYWSKYSKGRDYNTMVCEYLSTLLDEFGHGEVKVEINSMDNANLIGTAIAALS